MQSIRHAQNSVLYFSDPILKVKVAPLEVLPRAIDMDERLHLHLAHSEISVKLVSMLDSDRSKLSKADVRIMA